MNKTQIRIYFRKYDYRGFFRPLIWWEDEIQLAIKYYKLKIIYG